MKELHSWNVSYARARQLQSELACKVEFTRLKKNPKLIAGLDCAFSRDGKRIFAAVVVLRRSNFELVETVSASRKVTFPYIPGLLTFREAPVCIAAVKKLRSQPDVFIVDGQGVARPQHRLELTEQHEQRRQRHERRERCQPQQGDRLAGKTR